MRASKQYRYLPTSSRPKLAGNHSVAFLTDTKKRPRVLCCRSSHSEVATIACLDAEKHRPDLEGGGPLVLEDVEADTAQLVDVRVVDFCQEANLRARVSAIVRTYV